MFAAGLEWTKARSKFQDIMKEFSSNDRLNKQKSGTDDECVGEKENLLQDLKDLIDDASTKRLSEKKNASAKESSLISEGEDIRARALAQVKHQKTRHDSTNSQSITEAVVKVLESRTDQRQQELELGKRKLELEEKKLELQVRDAERRAKIDEANNNERVELYRMLIQLKKSNE